MVNCWKRPLKWPLKALSEGHSKGGGPCAKIRIEMYIAWYNEPFDQSKYPILTFTFGNYTKLTYKQYSTYNLNLISMNAVCVKIMTERAVILIWIHRWRKPLVGRWKFQFLVLVNNNNNNNNNNNHNNNHNNHNNNNPNNNNNDVFIAKR